MGELGARAICTGETSEAFALRWLSAWRQGLPAGTGWEDLIVTMSEPHFLHPRPDLHTGKSVRPGRFPLIYDPHGVVGAYIRASEETRSEQEGGNDAVCIRAQDPSLEACFAEAVQSGRTLIVEGIEPTDWPRIRQLASARLSADSGALLADIPGFPPEGLAPGGNGNFRLILVTENSGILCMPPEVFSVCRYVDCTVTGGSLQTTIARNLALMEGHGAVTDWETALMHVRDTDAKLADEDLMRSLRDGELAQGPRLNEVDPKNIIQVIEYYYDGESMKALKKVRATDEAAAANHNSAQMTFERVSGSFETCSLAAKKAALFYSCMEGVANTEGEVCRLQPKRVLAVAAAAQAQDPKAATEKARTDQLCDRILAGLSVLGTRAMTEAQRVSFSIAYALRLDLQADEGASVSQCHRLVAGSSSLSVLDQAAYEEEAQGQIATEYKEAITEWKIRQEEINRQWQEEQDRAEREEQERAQEAAKKGKPPRPGSAPKSAQGAKKKAAGKGPEKLPMPQKAQVPFKVRPPYPWLTSRTWLNLVALANEQEETGTFSKLLEFLHDREKHPKNPREQKWREWVTLLGSKIPDYDKGALSKFGRLMLCLAARPDKALHTLYRYAVETPNVPDPFVNLPLLPPEVVALSNPHTPVVFLRTPELTDADSLDAVQRAATAAKRECPPSARLVMQTGLEGAALDTVRRCMDTGHWVYIADIHATSDGFLAQLWSEIRERLDVHDHFRLFVTYAAPSGTTMLPPLIRDGVRVVINEPRGVKNTMLSLYRGLEETTLSAFCTNDWQRLVFGVLLVVSLLRERCTFSPEGVGESKGFGGCLDDAFAAITFLHRHLSRLKNADRHSDALVKETSWDAVRNTVTELLASGTTLERDRLVVKTLVDWWVHPDIVKAGVKVCKGFQMPGQPGVMPAKDQVEGEEGGEPPPPVKVSVLATHKQTIDMMPTVEQTELLGLPPLFDIASQRRVVSATYKLLRSSFLLDSVPKGERDAAAEAFLQRLPQPWTTQEIAEAGKGGEALPPKPGAAYIACLAAELRSASDLLRRVREDIERGESSPEGVRTRQLLAAGHVPEEWRQEYRCLEVGVWLGTVRRAHAQLERWREARRVPVPLWFGALLHPSRLIAACRQEQARAHKRSASTSLYRTQVLPPRRVPPPGFLASPGEPLLLEGLLLQGCSWNYDDNCLADPPDISKQWWSSPLHRLPVLRIEVYFPPELESPTPAAAPRLRDLRRMSSGTAWAAPPGKSVEAKQEDKEEAVTANIPIFLDVDRGESAHVMDVPLRCGASDASHWILRGAAVVLRDADQ
eukprot:Hpha_TRINITY_DN15743_c1_g2::TRINITY_DN15743_c1_g2_i3::g.40086::m.40086/K10408/DNAH; dynein heavy chain, axonemal